MNLGHFQCLALLGLFKTPYSSGREHGASAHGSVLASGWHQSSWMMFSAEMQISTSVKICWDSVSLPTPVIGLTDRLQPPAPRWCRAVLLNGSPLGWGGHIAWAPAGQCLAQAHPQPAQGACWWTVTSARHAAGAQAAQAKCWLGLCTVAFRPATNPRSVLGPHVAGWRACHGLASSAVQVCPVRTRSPCPVGSPHGPLLDVSSELHCKVSHCNALKRTIWPPGRKAIFFPAMKEITLKPVFVQSLLRRKYNFFQSKEALREETKSAPSFMLLLHPPLATEPGLYAKPRDIGRICLCLLYLPSSVLISLFTPLPTLCPSRSLDR